MSWDKRQKFPKHSVQRDRHVVCQLRSPLPAHTSCGLSFLLQSWLRLLQQLANPPPPWKPREGEAGAGERQGETGLTETEYGALWTKGALG